MTCSRCEQLARVGGCLDHRLQRGEVSFQVNADALYNFVEHRLSPTPIQIHSKRQYKRLLKERGYTDQVGSKEPMRDIRKKPFDSNWDRQVNTAIAQSIAETKKKPFSVIGKNLSPQQMKQVLQNDYRKQQIKKEKAHV